MIQDLRYAVRALLARPAFSAAAIVTLAIGIGGTSAMFGVIDAVLLRPLPFAEPDRLVMVWERNPGFSAGNVPASAGNFLSWHRVGAFERLAAINSSGTTLAGLGEPRRISVAVVTPGFFDLVGVRAAAGRLVDPDPSERGRTAVVTGGFARAAGLDRAIVGRSLRLGDSDVQVVGVLPDTFQFPGEAADVWMVRDLPPGSERNTGGHSLTVVARLRPGATLPSAQAELDAFVAGLNRSGPNAKWTATLVPIAREGLTADTTRALPILFGAVALLLVIACANVTGLLLVRALGREREFAIRAAVGAGRWHLVRHALAESAVIAAAAGVAGVLVAGWLLVAIRTAGPSDLIRLDTAAIDVRSGVFAAALALASAVAVGLAPLVRTRRTNLNALLGGASRGAIADPRLRALRAAIVAGEVALAVVLSVGALLLLRSYHAIRGIDSGVRIDRVMTMGVALNPRRYVSAESRQLFFDDLLARLRRTPGVDGAALTDNLPLSGASLFYFIDVEGVPKPAPGDPLYQADCRTVSAEYFRTLAIPVLAGRAFAAEDAAPSEPVAIVNRSFARRYFGAADPVGRHVRRLTNGEPSRRIVGVVADVRHHGLDTEAPLEIYLPAAQAPPYAVTVVAATAGEPAAAIPAMKAAVHAIDPLQPVSRVRSFEEVLSRTLAERRFRALLLVGFAASAVVLALVGVYGVLAFAVRQRTQEIGVRVALGASPADVVRLMVGQGLVPVLAGVACGGIAAWWLARLLTGLLFGVTAADPVSFFWAGVALVAGGAMACVIPARRAARTDPLEALRVS